MSTSALIVRVADTERDERREYVFACSPIRVGRSQRNELALQHAFVSHCHGIFLFDSDQVAFVDVGSTNGSFLNGTRLDKNQRVTLSGSAAITIGALRLEARLEHRQASPPPADAHQRSALLIQRFAQSFVELRRGQHQLMRELGLPVPSANKLQAIDSARELLVYLLDPAASDDRVDELRCAYADLMRHEVALVSAIGAGCRELLDELSPANLAPDGLGGVASWLARLFGHDARWRRLENKTDELQEQSALSSVVLGRSFVRAYVRAYVQARAAPERENSAAATGQGNDSSHCAEQRGTGGRAEMHNT